MNFREVQSRYMDLASDPIAVARLAPQATQAYFVYVNPAFTVTFGGEPEGWVGRPAGVVHPQGQENPFGRSRVANLQATGQTATIETVVVGTDGQHLSMDMSIFAVEDEAGTGTDICATYRAAPDRGRGAPDAARLKAALNAYPDPIVIYDDDLRLVFCNDGYAESMSDNPEDLVPGMHLEDVLRLAIAAGRYPVAVGREDEWVAGILSPATLESEHQDVELDGDIHHRLLRYRSENGDYLVIRLNSTELVRQKRSAEETEARLIAALNAYPAPFVIYDSDDCLVVCNDAYRTSMSENPEDLVPGTHRTEVARIAIRAGKIANAVGREEEWMSDAHQQVDVSKPVQDLELPGDVHHRLLRTRVENGDLVMLWIDTTELVRERRALEASQDRLFSAIRAYPDPFAIYDADHHLVVWNTAYARSMTDNPSALSPGTHLRDILQIAVDCGRIPAARGQEENWVDD